MCASAPHSELLKEAAAAVTHAGHGTVIRALAAGVPVVCMPMGRDQKENAARVEFRRAGVRIGPTASASKIRQALREVLASPVYRDSARRLGEEIAKDARDSRAVHVLESMATRLTPA